MVVETRDIHDPHGGCHAEAVPGASGEAEQDPGESLPLLDPRVAALLPQQLLQPGELIILLIKPSPWFIVLESLGSLTFLALVMLTGIWFNRLRTPLFNERDLILAVIALAGLRLFWQFLEWLSRVYVLTDRRVLRVQGVLRVSVFQCALKKIQHTTATFSIRERLVGLGTIGFATAGTAFAEAHWRMIAHPLEVHQIVVQALQRYK